MRIARRHWTRGAWPIILPVALAVAWWTGRSMALGANRKVVLAGLAVFVLVIPPANLLIRRYVGRGAFAVEFPILFMLASTLVWRQRTTYDLAYDPLDRAAQLRVLCVAVGGALGFAALLRPPLAEALPRRRLTTLPFRLYLTYIAIVVLAVPVSVKPLHTSYRVVELVAGCVVLLGAYRALGNRAAPRIEATLYWFTAALLGSVWVGRFLFPSRALSRPLDTSVPWKWELVGVYPTLAANTVGAFAVAFTIWSLARAMNAPGRPRRRGVAYALALGGVVTLIAAQYRTGYVALVAGCLVLFWFRKRSLVVALAAIVLFALVYSPAFVRDAQPYALRGQTIDEAQRLSGRLDYWSAAIPVWERSPVIGRGLWTASRFEVLTSLGLTTTAAVHSTWVEALVGTGLAGATVLAAVVLLALRRAWNVARAGPRAPIGPLVLLVAMLVRSLTGNLFESFGHEQMIFLAILLAMEDPIRARVPVPTAAARAGTSPDDALALRASPI